MNVNENNYQIEEVILLIISSNISLSHSFLCWIIILIWIYFSMVFLSFFFSLSICTLTHTLSVCFSLSLSLSISTSPSLLLSISFPLSFFCSPLLSSYNSTYFLLFIYLVLFALFHSSYLFCLSACPWTCYCYCYCCCLSVSDRLSSYLCCQRHRGNLNRIQKELDIMWKIGEMRGKMDEWVGWC